MTSLHPYILGLDVGIASIGWCLTNSERIIDLGVRCFDKAENEKGESKGLEWRTIKTQRRRLRRRAGRLSMLRKLCSVNGLVASTSAIQFCSDDGVSPWELRLRALDRQLSSQDLARVIYHIVKHRGFLSTRKAELKDEKKDAGKLYAGVSRTKELIAAGGWRTPGELAVRDPAFADAKRNKQGEYKNTFDRNLLRSELQLIFSCQRALGSSFVQSEFEQRVLEIFDQQLPALSGAQMLKMVGRCKLEKEEFRAPKHSWTAERFLWMTRLNNLRVVENGERRSLTEEERLTIIDLPYDQKEVKFKTVRARLKKSVGFSDSARFVGLTYSQTDKDPESTTLIKLTGWHELKKAMGSESLAKEWTELSKNKECFDRVALALTLYKTDDEIRENLSNAAISREAVEALLHVSFSGFIQLSLKALNKIVPHMESGQRYDEACLIAGYHHSEVRRFSRQKYLPRISKDEVRNPVVFRALVQARKVVNAIVCRYGSPSAIHIELARDLSRPYEDRLRIKKAQDSYQQQKEKARADFLDKFEVEPNPRNQDLFKYRLYEEQQGKCAYSLAALDLARLFEAGYAEIDHILPYSRSFDDSQNNKVLVLTAENRNKQNSIPFEYLGGENNSPRWLEFQGWVISNKAIRGAKRERLLRRSFNEREAGEFKERNLNDTRYLARFLKNYIEENLELSDGKGDRVLCVNGQFTSFLRTRWGLLKAREQNDKHHALDAAVIAAASESLRKRVSDFSRMGKTIQRPDGAFVVRDTGEVLIGEAACAVETRFPAPWEGFRDELLARLHDDPKTELEKLELSTYTQEEIANSKPIFVSRAPKRRNKGAAHKETIRSAKHIEKGISTVKTALTDIKLKDLENAVGFDDPRNKPLFDGLKAQLERFSGDGKKAFAEPFFKPNRAGEPTALVRTIKLKTTQKGGVPVRGGIADQATMIRVDIFSKLKKFYAVPIYQSDRTAKELPSHAVVGGKPREDWIRMDDTFSFIFSLYPNDVVHLQDKDKNVFGYFAGLDVSTGAIHIEEHDRDKQKVKDGRHKSLGIRTVNTLTKYHVDPLGRRFKVRKEKRDELA